MTRTAPDVLTAGAAHALALKLGLLQAEYEAITAALGRLPTRTELAVFAGMWSEHCSYKSSLHLLKTLPKDGPAVLAGPGSHAGVVEVGDGWAVAFKVESHNHPSAVEPYQGAATGVGGILRDIIAQGARPCAVMDGLCFGLPDSARSRRLVEGVVAGIAGYGNAFGVPNVGGRTVYDRRYDGNPLVNALAAGLVAPAQMRTGRAAGLGNAVLYVGATTGRDGILGAAFASEELGDDAVDDRPHVQVGDPFSGKKLMEACLSFTPAMGMVACQDMGAAGITCAAMEMAAAGEVGIQIDLETVPLREAGMAPQEIMLSESQERFLFVVATGHEDEAVQHFESYGVHAAICGRVVEGDRVEVIYEGASVVDLPAALVADGAPPSHWPVATELPAVPAYPRFASPATLGDTLLQLLGLPSIADKEPVYSRYDQTVGNRTVRAPNQAEAAVLKLPQSRRGFALSLVSRGDLCAGHPYLGAQATLACAVRDLACSGAEVLAITDGLNLASPRDPVKNLELAEVVRGLGDGLRTLEIPVTGGNVSLYNESAAGPIPPTPMVGAIGRIDDVRQLPSAGFHAGQVLFLLGAPSGLPVASAYGSTSSGQDTGDPPHVDLAADQALARLLVAEVRQGHIAAAKGSSRGGLGVALAKLCLRGGAGAHIALPKDAPQPADKTGNGSAHARLDWWLFGEYAGTAWVATAAEHADAFATAAREAGVVARRVGEAGGERLVIRDVFGLPLTDLRRAFAGEVGPGEEPSA